MNVANLLPEAPLRPIRDLAMTQQSLAEWWVGGEVTHRIANPPFLSAESTPPVATGPRTNQKRIVNVASGAAPVWLQ